ncbi:MAG: addiction module protein [Flavobacterium sp.]
MDTIKLNIDLSLNQLLEAIKQLSPKDRLKVNDAIWNEETEIPIEHQNLVLSRLEKSKNNPERLLDWEEVSKKL